MADGHHPFDPMPLVAGIYLAALGIVVLVRGTAGVTSWGWPTGLVVLGIALLLRTRAVDP
jgi:hypothetical protein